MHKNVCIYSAAGNILLIHEHQKLQQVQQIKSIVHNNRSLGDTSTTFGMINAQIQLFQKGPVSTPRWRPFFKMAVAKKGNNGVSV